MARKRENHRVQVTLTPKQYERLEELAKEMGVSKTGVINNALLFYYELRDKK